MLCNFLDNNKSEMTFICTKKTIKAGVIVSLVFKNFIVKCPNPE